MLKKPKSRKILINGLRHQFYFWGNPRKPKLFLIHGWLDTAASFHFLCEKLQQHFYCIAPDLRGYGKSEHSKNPLGYFFYEYIADLHAIFQHFSPREKIKVLGHSLGGAVTAFYAGSFPERVSHFINVEGFAFRDNPPDRGPEKVQQWICSLHTQRFNVFSNLEHFAKRLTKANPRLPLERARFFAPFLTQRVPGGIKMSADPKHKLAEPYIYSKPIFYAFWNKIEAKCLLVSAELSNMNDWIRVPNLKKEMKERLEQFPRRSKKITIPDCGHMVHHEKPEILAGLILDFLHTVD